MPQANDNVAISGLGVLSPIGIGREEFWSALCAGKTGIRDLADARQIPRVGAQIADYDARAFIGSAHLRRMDKVSRAVVAAAAQALRDAAAEVRPVDRGIVVGTAFGNVGESLQYLARLFDKGPGLASPMMFPNLVLNAPAGYAAMETSSLGVNFTVSDGEVSAEQALLLAVDAVRYGRAELVLAGGVDERAEAVVHAYRRIGALSGQHGGPERCAPFDACRNGVVLGEGAGMLVLEPLSRMRERGAAAYAVIESTTSFGVASSPWDWPRATDEAVDVLRTWLEQALPREARVDAVFTNANGSRALDGFLLEAMTRLFGEAAGRIALTSVRGAVGEFGAAGAVSLVAAALSLRHQILPPLCNFQAPPPTSPFQFVADRAVARPLDRVLHFSVARGGSVVAVLLCRPDA